MTSIIKCSHMSNPPSPTPMHMHPLLVETYRSWITVGHFLVVDLWHLMLPSTWFDVRRACATVGCQWQWKILDRIASGKVQFPIVVIFVHCPCSPADTPVVSPVARLHVWRQARAGSATITTMMAPHFNMTARVWRVVKRRGGGNKLFPIIETPSACSLPPQHLARCDEILPPSSSCLHLLESTSSTAARVSAIPTAGLAVVNPMAPFEMPKPKQEVASLCLCPPTTRSLW